MTKIKRALLSVYDKSGIVPFAKALESLGVEIISTGGTCELLKKEKIPVKEISDVTRFPEMLGGRVKTLHPNVHAGLLALRDDPQHLATLAEHNIKPIDLVAVNLYPFRQALQRTALEGEIIEMIDIGGASLLRSAAKNFRFVASVSDPADYEAIIEELQKNDKSLSEATLKRLAAKAFQITSSYDGLIHHYLSGKAGGASGIFPEKLSFDFEKASDLRYGENPHQRGALYREHGVQTGIVAARKLQGKELSFNNILDLNAASEMTEAFSETACAIIKHTSPCGFALGCDSCDAFKKAYACDPLSAFGSIIGFNGGVDGRTAKEILKGGFVECVIAKNFSPEALTVFKTKKNLRILSSHPAASKPEFDFKKVAGGLLLQDCDAKDPAAAGLQYVTRIKPKKGDIRELLFAFKVCRYVKSNAIVIVKNGATVGLGMGQPSRVDSMEQALKRAGKRAAGSALASDGFFPKTDSISLAKKYGIRSIIQPGGSIQDPEVIRACDRAKIGMVFAGIRHFRH